MMDGGLWCVLELELLGVGAGEARRGNLSAHGKSLDTSLPPCGGRPFVKEEEGGAIARARLPHSTPPHPMCVRACRGRVLCVTVGPGRRAGAGGWCL
jgi:hypothetical protein